MNKDKMLAAYQKAINEIDDFFEYRNESQKDRKRVHLILDDLTKELVKCRSSTPS